MIFMHGKRKKRIFCSYTAVFAKKPLLFRDFVVESTCLKNTSKQEEKHEKNSFKKVRGAYRSPRR